MANESEISKPEIICSLIKIKHEIINNARRKVIIMKWSIMNKKMK